MAIRRALAASVLLLLLSSPTLAGDGKQVWRTIETPHFVVHFDKPLRDLAQRIATAAERSHVVLAPVFGHQPKEKTHVVVLDTTDSANGFANVLPRNRITLFVSAPTELSSLNDHDDWLYSLTAHEYAHILHLDTIGGLPFFYNKVFGKTWAPNQIQPRWMIEGIATLQETRQTAGGRNRSALFDMQLRMAVRRGVEFKLDELSNEARQFPHGNAAYLYGGHFLQYIFDRYGHDKLEQMSKNYGSSPIPYGLNRSIHSATGKGFTTLYEEWRDYVKVHYSTQIEGVERRGIREGRRMTFAGEDNTLPRFTKDGKHIVWLQSDGYSTRRFRRMPANGNIAQATDYTTVDRAGGFDLYPDGSMVVERGVQYRTAYSFQELFYWNRKDRSLTQLTRAGRARSPTLSPDQTRIAYYRNHRSRSSLMVMPNQKEGKGRVVWQGKGRFEQAAAPAWSPDGKHLVFSAWLTGGRRDILMVEVETGKIRKISDDRALDTGPKFSPDGRFVYFSSDRTGIHNVYARDLESNELWQVTNVVGGALLPDISPDGKRMIYQGFEPRGFELFQMELDPKRWLKAQPYIDERPEPTVLKAEKKYPERAYRPVETLAPQSYTAELNTTGAGTTLALTTQGNDVVGQHNYSLTATVDLTDGDVGLGGTYTFSRLWPILRVAASRNAARRRGFIIDGENTAFTEEVLGATASVRLPVLRDPRGSGTLSIDYDFDWLRNTEDELGLPDPNTPVPQMPETDVFVAGLALRFSYSDSRGFIYTVGPQEGKEIALSLRLNLPSFGSDFESLDATYRATYYQQVPWANTGSVMARVAGGLRTTNRRRTGVFVLGGVPDQDILNAVLNDIRAGSTGFLRGFPTRAVQGSQFHLVNLEYRQELWDVQRGVSTLPFLFRRVHAALLLDAGHAFDGAIEPEEFRLSVGAALRVDGFVAYSVPGSIDFGYSRGLTEGGIDEFWLLLTGTL